MKIYVVRNSEGKFFRAVGFGGGSKGNWVDTLDRAKFYTKIGQAKSRITFFSKNYPEYGVPELIEFNLDISNAVVMDMSRETIGKIEDQIRRYQKKLDSFNHLGGAYGTNYYQNQIDGVKKCVAKLKFKHGQ